MHRIPFQISVADLSLPGHIYPAKNPKAVVLIIHGMGEYGRRYEQFVIPKFLDHGLAVVTYDQFGHGSGPGKKGHHPGFEYLLESIDKCLEKSAQEFRDTPIVIYGHSMGGNVALNYVLSRPDRIHGAVISSPFLRLSFEPPAWKLFMGKLLGKILPSITMANEIDASAISRIPEEVEIYVNDPLIHDRVSPAYSIAFMEKGEHVLKRAQELTKPMLLLHGTSDRLTDYKASRELAEIAGKNVQYFEVEGGFHELHNDLNRQEVMDHVLSWIDTLVEN